MARKPENKTRKSIAVIGEGITEKYYIEALKKLSDLTVEPKELGKKASNLKKLGVIIKKSIRAGYDEVYCLIDMDNKRTGVERDNYLKLKHKYHGTHQRKGQSPCKLVFVETERCMEMWFLFHFTRSATTREFGSYKELEKELRKYLPDYEKTERYFRSIRNLHKEIDRKGGSLDRAKDNARSSVETRDLDQRDYTYSEMHLLIDALLAQS